MKRAIDHQLLLASTIGPCGGCCHICRHYLRSLLLTHLGGASCSAGSGPSTAATILEGQVLTIDTRHCLLLEQLLLATTSDRSLHAVSDEVLGALLQAGLLQLAIYQFLSFLLFLGRLVERFAGVLAVLVTSSSDSCPVARRRLLD